MLLHISMHVLETLAIMTHASFSLSSVKICMAIGMALMSTQGLCAEQRKGEASKLAESKVAATDAQQFCANNAAIIGDARISWQTTRLLDLETDIRRSLMELDAKKTEYVAWLRKRDDAMKQGADSVVAIYARMRPDAAALQLAAMDDAMAAALLAKLQARVAGAILNEMEPGRAAHLTRVMTGPGVSPDGKKL